MHYGNCITVKTGNRLMSGLFWPDILLFLFVKL